MIVKNLYVPVKQVALSDLLLEVWKRAIIFRFSGCLDSL
jgi:hypothetical protein